MSAELTLPLGAKFADRKPKEVDNSLAAENPVAQVLLEVPLAHLDKPFDYAVPAKFAAAAQPGTRVQVRFAGQIVTGFILSRIADSDYGAKLQPLRKVISPEPVLHPEIVLLTERLAARLIGTRADILRLAVPPRHAATELAEWQPPATPAVGEFPVTRVVQQLLPGINWAQYIAEKMLAAASQGVGVLTCVPDRKSLNLLSQALAAASVNFVELAADLGNATRYRNFLAISRGQVNLVIGTRAAAYAPVANLGLVIIWDDGDEQYVEPRSPYPHTRDVLLLRSELAAASFLSLSYSRSVESQYLVRTGWATDSQPERSKIREQLQVSVIGNEAHQTRRERIPSAAFQEIRSGLTVGPVLVQVPRLGYALGLACQTCFTKADCQNCHGSLAIPARDGLVSCTWCGAAYPLWQCRQCGGSALRAPTRGTERTAEEFGKAFPNIPVKIATAAKPISGISTKPQIVITTPEMAPPAAQGYQLVLLLDSWALLGRDDLRAEETALRHWLNAVGHLRPGGKALITGAAAHPARQALLRVDPVGYAERLIADRAEAALPPTVKMVAVTAEPEVLAKAAEDSKYGFAEIPGVVQLGPVPAKDGKSRLILRTPRVNGPVLLGRLAEMQKLRSVKRLGYLQLVVDPYRLVGD